MLFAIGVLAMTIGALAAVAYALMKAPEGYEDGQGFHIIKRTRGSAVLARRKFAQPREAGSLKGARVNP